LSSQLKCNEQLKAEYIQQKTNKKYLTTDNEQRTTNEKDRVCTMRIKAAYLLILTISLLITTKAFSLQYTFQPRVSTSEEYTSNVFLSEDNEKDDYITTVSAGFTAAALGKTGELEISYDPAYSFYKDTDENNGWSHDAKLNGYTQLTKRTRFEIHDRFLRTQDPLRDEDFLELQDGSVEQEGDATVRKNRETYYRNTANARLSNQFGKEDSIYAGFTYGLLRNNDPTVEDNDYYSPNAGLNYWFGPKFGIETGANYTKAKFDQDNGFIGTPTADFDNYAGSIKFIGRTGTRFSIFAQHNQIYRDYESNNFNNLDYMVYAPSAGFTYVVKKGLNLRLGGGYFYQDVDGGDSNQGFFGNSQIDKIWASQRGSISLSALTGLDQNDFGAQNIGLERYAAVQGSALYKLTQTISWDLNGSYRYSDAVGNADRGANDDSGKNVQRYRVGSGFTIEPLKWMAIRLDYTFNKLNSDNNFDDYDEHRGLIKITLTPSQPYRSK
jgi:hypothetical protein